jgi:hypothetical protein
MLHASEARTFPKPLAWVIKALMYQEGWRMDSKEKQLTELLGLTARTLTHLDVVRVDAQ